jgi:hypothetical protein
MPVERQVTRSAEPEGRLLELACSQACGDAKISTEDSFCSGFLWLIKAMRGN